VLRRIATRCNGPPRFWVFHNGLRHGGVSSGSHAHGTYIAGSMATLEVLAWHCSSRFARLPQTLQSTSSVASAADGMRGAG
jgi:hypothetical protein